jgi:arylsulfatase
MTEDRDTNRRGIRRFTRRQFLGTVGALGGAAVAGAAGVWAFKQRNGMQDAAKGSDNSDGNGAAGGETSGQNTKGAASHFNGKRPNVVIILADDMGYSDIGCYGGSIETPNLDKLAAGGVRLSQFCNTARCSPSRASLLTGLHPHQAGMAHLQGEYGPYTKQLSSSSVTIAEVLKPLGYGTYMSGKWHLGAPQGSPHKRGFDKAYVYPATSLYFDSKGVKLNDSPLGPSSFPKDYFATDDITDKAIAMLKDHLNAHADKPFFLYLPFTAPHFPLQAKPADIAKYKGRFDRGWDQLRKERYERMKQIGLIPAAWELSALDSSDAYSWDNEPHQAWRLRAMEVYAAMVDCMDQNIGKLVKMLEQTGQIDNTLLIFLSDNGGNAEFENIKDPSKLPGGRNYDHANGHYGLGWANMSNTPFRMYKHYIHEGGIAAPFIAHWPDRLKQTGVICHKPAQLTDVMATIVDVTGATYPEEFNGHQIIPPEGASMMSIFEKDESAKDYLFWEHEGNCGVRQGNWKLVKFYNYPWELYDMEKDGTEMHDVAKQHPDIVSKLNDQYVQWTVRANVKTKLEYAKYLPKGKKIPSGPANIKKIKEKY